MAAVVVLDRLAGEPEVLGRELRGTKQGGEQPEIEELLAAARMHRGIDRPNRNQNQEGEHEHCERFENGRD